MSALHVIDIKICTTKKKYVPVFQVEVKFVRLYYAVFIVMFIHDCMKSNFALHVFVLLRSCLYPHSFSVQVIKTY